MLKFCMFTETQQTLKRNNKKNQNIWMLRSHGHSVLASPHFIYFAQWLCRKREKERASVLSEMAFFLQDARELKGASRVYYAIVGILSAQSRNILGLMYQWTRGPEPPLHCYSQINSSDFLSYCRCSTVVQQQAWLLQSGILKSALEKRNVGTCCSCFYKLNDRRQREICE